MYFQDFPVLPYPYYIGNNRSFALARNILRRVAFSDQINNQSAFIDYDIKDGERPEHIANRLYGNPNHHWIILLANNITDPYHGWYKSQTILEQYIQKKYSGIALYFTDRNNGFTYSSVIGSGCTLSQSQYSESITKYRETFCELTVEAPKFVEGNAVIAFPSGSTTGIYIQKITPCYLGVNYFSVERPTTGDGSNGSQEKPIIDPLTLQSADYEAYGTVIGNRIQPTGVNGLTGATVEFYQTYIAQYMGVSGSEVTNYAISNFTYEQDQNEMKRTIRVLSPAFLGQALNELKSALGV